MDVKHLRQWIDDPRPMGLPKEAENLVILLFAAQTDHTFYRHGGPDDQVDTPKASRRLRTADGESAGCGRLGRGRQAGRQHLRGGRPKLLSAGNVATLSADVKKIADQARRPCDTYRQKLHDRMTCMGLAPEGTDRMKTALATQKLVGLISAAEAANVVGLLARAGGRHKRGGDGRVP